MSESSGWQVEQAAPRHYHDLAWRFMDPFAHALVESSVVAGDAVLDVACGTGIATRAAARVAGPSGSVVGIDVNGAMLELAAEISENDDSISWREASALDLPFGDATFDRAICQQGVQFFPNSAAGVSEMARVTKDGGSVAVTVWTDTDDSPYFDAMYHMLIAFCGATDDDLAWFASAESVVDWFVTGGLDAPSVDRITRTVLLPAVEAFLPAHMKATPWATQFEALSPEGLIEAVSFVENRTERWRTPEGLAVPFESHLVAATI